MGKSVETHRMRNKPIKEGYNFFALSTITGFIINFTPDGRTAAKKNKQEYKNVNNKGKIESMILYVCSIIDSF